MYPRFNDLVLQKPFGKDLSLFKYNELKHCYSEALGTSDFYS